MLRNALLLLLALLTVVAKIQKYELGKKKTDQSSDSSTSRGGGEELEKSPASNIATPLRNGRREGDMRKKSRPLNAATVKYNSTDVDVSGSSLNLLSSGLACDLEDYTCIQRTYRMSYLFPTPLLYQQVVHDQRTFQLNQEIKELMLDLEDENDGCKFNLHGGYRSQDGFLNRKEGAIVWLKQEIEKRARLMLALSGAKDTPFFVDGWGAVLRHGHGQSVLI